MELTPKERILVFALGIYLRRLQKRVSEGLDVSIQKSVFIDFVLKTKLFEKKERALYKNLEGLEKKKLLIYPYKGIVLTDRGWRAFKKIEEGLMPYFTVMDNLNRTNLVKETRKIQTVFRKLF